MTDNWNYFTKDTHYSDVLKDRLKEGVQMDSAKAMAEYMELHFTGDLNVLDFGSGPGHYYQVLKNTYSKGDITYTGTDIDADNVRFGNEFFKNNDLVKFYEGSVLTPEQGFPININCVISANTLPHVPTIIPLLNLLERNTDIKYFIFRMLIGQECVQTRKHLSEDDFENLFTDNFQYNNIYSAKYLQHYLGSAWDLSINEDVFENQRLDNHKLPAEESNSFYTNRVSRREGNKVFKGEIYMPWRFVIGKRIK